MIRELAPRHGRAPEDVEVEVIGAKPGEKLYEELMSDEETRRAIEPIVTSITPAFRGLYQDIAYRYPTVRKRWEMPTTRLNRRPSARPNSATFIAEWLRGQHRGEVNHASLNSGGMATPAGRRR